MKKFIYSFLIIGTFIISFANVKNNPKEMIAKFYVSLYQLNIISEYQSRVKKYDVDDLLVSIKDPDFISELYLSKKYPEKYFNYDVFFIYDLSITHSEPYILGIDNNYKIIKISGFNERIHISSDESDFKNYNDSLYVSNINLIKISNTEIINIISTVVKLRTYSESPYQVKVKNISYTKMDDKILSECTTIEFVTNYDGKNRTIVKKYKVEIPKSGTIKILLQ